MIVTPSARPLGSAVGELRPIMKLRRAAREVRAPTDSNPDSNEPPDLLDIVNRLSFLSEYKSVRVGSCAALGSLGL